MPPIVSLGLPVFNGEEFLDQAIQSILDQDFDDFELVIRDNASTDRTEAICRGFAARDERVRYLRAETNEGAAPNYNAVFAETTGKFFKWVAADDYHGPTFLRRCLETLDADATAVLAYPLVVDVDDSGTPLEHWGSMVRAADDDALDRFADVVLHEKRAFPIFGLIRRDAVARTSLIGGYTGSDWVLLAELALLGRFVEIPEELFFHREHAGRSTRRYKNLKERTEWFDTRRTARFSMPMWRVGRGHLSAAWRLAPSMTGRLRGSVIAGRWAWERRSRLRREVQFVGSELVESVRRRRSA